MEIYSIKVVDRKGKEHLLEAPEGYRLMEVIRDNGLPIKAECGGACACATCHVYVDKAWLEKLSPPLNDEVNMLDEAFEVEGNSRLSCQIIINENLDGLKVTIAPDGDN
ncbi:MAG: 2Fe-2S iron-sulfur cluster-binding protein [Alphaproteobacteria bacterium]|jgi:2Fe-2S ferredoxin